MTKSLRRSLAMTHRRLLVECYISMSVEIWQQVIESAPSLLKKTDIWPHFGFHDLTGEHELDETRAVCKICLTAITKPR